MNESDIKISVIIPAHNEENFLPLCLGSLKNQDFKENYEIIVVDNNSDDKTVEIAKMFCAKVVVETQRGVCFARSRGAKEARGDIIVSTDSDCVFPSDWLTNIYVAFSGDLDAVAVFGPFEYGPKPHWGRAYSTILFKTVEYFYSIKGRLIYVAASNSAYRKSILEAIGGYNTKLAQGGDEFDLLKKLRRKGKTIYLPENRVSTSSRRLNKGLLYSLFVSLLGYYILDYYIASQLTGKSLLGQWPSYREMDYRKRSLLLSMIYFILLVFFTLSLFLGSGKFYKRHRVVTGSERIYNATKGTINEIRER